ncbi:GSCOCG00006084001-RA-CDS [Cotesia congregata]|nr:GSCOCG00006084001-RA-CDS [Cotesia congregata]
MILFWSTTTSGVPQGSVLGPILFLLIMNSAAKRLAYTNHGLFADDMYIYLHCYSHQIHEATRQLNLDAQAVVNWARDNGLEVNILKTKAMVIGSNNKVKTLMREGIPDLEIDGVPLPYVESTKCLGLHFMYNLSWNLHISKTISKINSALYSLKLRRNIYTSSIKKLLVSATILPLIDYCSIVLLNSNYENNCKLQRSLNSAIRFIFNLKRDEHVSPYRRELGWLSIKSRRIYFTCCYFYKLLETSKPSYLRELFQEDLSVRRSERLAAKKNNILFKFPNFSTTQYESSFVITVIRLWEELPEDIINSSSLEVFKNKIFDYLFNLDV